MQLNKIKFSRVGGIAWEQSGRSGLASGTAKWQKVCPLSRKGEFTPLEEIVESFEEIAAGKWDHLSEQAFMCVGGIKQAAKRK